MAWAYIETVSEGDWEDYEKVMNEVGESPPEGLIVHVAGRYDRGFRIIDVWESEEAYGRFKSTRLMPAFERALGQERAAENPPEKDILDVEHMIRPS